MTLPKLYDIHCPEYWRTQCWFAFALWVMHQEPGTVQDYFNTIRRKKSALARKAPKYPLLVFEWCNWSDISASCGKLSADDDNLVLKVKVALPISHESRRRLQLMAHWNVFARWFHADIFGPFEPEDLGGMSGILLIGADLCKVKRIWHATEEQKARLATFTNRAGHYSLRLHKHRTESLSVRELKKVGIELLLSGFPLCDLVSLATPEDISKYHYPDGPKEKK